MIRYTLRCRPAAHDFDGWFRSGDDFETQRSGGFVSCPVCGATDVEKALMRPALVTGGTAAAPDVQAAPAAPAEPPSGPPHFANAEAAKAFAKLQEMTRELRRKAEHVGPRFAEEARRIHYGETEARQIYGEASRQEVESLGEEGIVALPLPPLPEDHN